ncbi:erythroid membrane-associated protein isoform X3 [Rhinopithecus roxellana]|uniref:erythroid membrane-associated protein isoform X3 n=1 Tax=Rhinopithecus roxellana TaxID=61622 RepID=UPI001237402B|nr:erythroid membrane-associated protein isoform X3 [Rhinopithecus roxellana]
MEMASSAGSWLSGCLIPLLFLRLSVHVSGRTGDTSKFHVALLGGTAELLCPLSLWPGTVPKEVRWLRSPFPQRSQVVHMFRDGKDQDEDLMPEYKGRTVLVRDAQEGSVTLQILDVRLEDQGSYRCLIQVGNLSKEDTVILQVAELKRAAANSGWRRARLHFVAVTLDPETAHPKLILSEDQRCVRLGDRRQPVPDNPQRFDFVVSILGSEYFTTGCHYWEVYVGHKTKWILGVCSESVSRKGKVTASPANGHWLLRQSHGNEYEALTSPQTSFRLKEPPRCVGIFLDYEAGVISFYNVTNKSHIFTFTHSFSGPLRPFFEPCLHDGGKNTAPLVICSELHKSEESIVPKPEGKGHANGDVSLKVNSSLLPPKGPELKDIILSLPSDLGPALQGLKVPSF